MLSFLFTTADQHNVSISADAQKMYQLKSLTFPPSYSWIRNSFCQKNHGLSFGRTNSDTYAKHKATWVGKPSSVSLTTPRPHYCKTCWIEKSKKPQEQLKNKVTDIHQCGDATKTFLRLWNSSEPLWDTLLIWNSGEYSQEWTGQCS